MMDKKSFVKIFTRSNILNGLFAIVILVVMFSPPAKALVLRGLMQVGLFQPDVSERQTVAAASPELTLEDENGHALTLSSLKGKVVFINFWATWCPPCIAEMPGINSLAEKLKSNKDVQFVTVDVDHNFKKSRSFLQKHHLTLPLYQATVPIPPEMLGEAIPTTIIIDKTGKMVFRLEGGADYGNSKVEAYLTKLSK
jgi:thiol-disulfide isomerase/thioredoxin